MRLRSILPAVAVAPLLAGCTAAAVESETPAPFAACPAYSGGGTELPDVSLDCFTGDGQVRLADLRGPAVINIWASFCGPCREELPIMQRLADAAEGELTVLGVDTSDTRTAAASFGADHGVRMPTLFDPDRRLVTALRTTSLPSTVFVDAAGKTYVHRYPMDAAALTEQVREHTGVEVHL